MKELVNNILAQIEVELDDIDLYGYDIIETSLSIVRRLHKALNDLRIKLQTYTFSTKEEEIFFFKNQKPELLSRLLYFHKIYRIEAQCPTGSNEVMKLYINKELDNLTYFFNRNLISINIIVHIQQFMTSIIFYVVIQISAFIQIVHC